VNNNDDNNFDYFFHASLINVNFFWFAELMILGFISLLLTFGQSYIVKICIPSNVADKFLPCPYRSNNDANNDKEHPNDKEHRRKLLFYEHRYLSEDATPYQCKEVTMFPFFIFL
jgi:hypothetical protein